MKMIIEDGALKLVIKSIVIAMRHPFRLSEEGNFHMPLLSFSVSSNGFAFYLLGFAISFIKVVKDEVQHHAASY